MGLDMYLTGKLSLLSFNCKNLHDTVKDKLNSVFNNLFDSNIELDEIVFEAAYWRKCNQIHAWFVENVQEGEDFGDGQDFDVNIEQLIKLRNTCIYVLKNKELAPSLLPTKSGTFFGPTEYEEYYFTVLNRTVELINRALDIHARVETMQDSCGVYFYYSSVW